MTGVRVADLVQRFGEGSRATVVVPLTGQTFAEVEEQWQDAAAAGADMVEWRLDFLEGVAGPGAVQGVDLGEESAGSASMPGAGGGALLGDDAAWLDTAARLAAELREKTGVPVLATFRTTAEGGRLPVDANHAGRYRGLVQDTACWADAVDVELVRPGADHLIAELSGLVPVVASFHSFEPGVDEEFLKDTLRHMEETGASVAKIAWMVGDQDDLETVLDAQLWAGRNMGTPALVIGMGEMGRATRLGAAAKRSAFTFATAGAASAPGQPSVEELRASL